METDILGLGLLAEPDERNAYGLRGDDRVEAPDGLSPSRPPASIRAVAEVEGSEKQEELLAAVAPAWNDYLGTRGPITERRSNR